MSEATIIDGRRVATGIRDRLRSAVAELQRDQGVMPGLATILVGEDPGSVIYVRRKGEACENVGIASYHHALAAETTREELVALIDCLNADENVHGILLQLPLPAQLDGDQLTGLIDPLKDVDGLTPVNAGLLAQGRPSLVPCTPAGVIELLHELGTDLRGTRAVIVGRSTLVGKPLAAMLLAEDATVTQCHSRTRDLAGVCSQAELLVAAVGVPKLIGADMVANGATVIDVGINRVETGLVGDVDFDAAREKAAAITPVPGGVGPMTIAMLLDNTLKAARMQLTAR